MATTAEQRREDRLARTLARRAERPAHPQVTTTVGDLREGDYVLTVPTQHGVRGMSFDTHVTAVGPDHTWTFGHGRRRQPVEATRVTTRHGAVSFPSSFTVTVRRAS